MDNQDPQAKKTLLWIIAVLALVGIVGLLIFLKMYTAEPIEDTGVFTPPVLAPEITTLEDVKEFEKGKPLPEVDAEKTVGDYKILGEHILGNQQATVSIIEYSDLNNTYSNLMHPELEDLVETDTDVNWIFRHYPLSEEENSYLAAYVTECVYKQLGDDAFWPLMNTVLSDELVKGSSEDLEAAGRNIVPEKAMYQSCLKGESVEMDVKDDKRQGFVFSKVRTTPTFVIVNNETEETRVIEGIVTRNYLNNVLSIMK